MIIACIILSIIIASLLTLCLLLQRAVTKQREKALLAERANFTSTETLRREVESLNDSLKHQKESAETIQNQSKESYERQLNEVRTSYERQISETKDAYERQIAELKNSHANALKEERESMSNRFKTLASEILQSNSKQLNEQSKSSVEAVLAPMKTRLEEFTKNFKECYSSESQERLSMREEIKRLHELSIQVSGETSRLTQALKGNTGIQGKWGEMVLQNILEHSGLEEGMWFVTQERNDIDNGTYVKPDAVIHCPGGRDIIIDSKASLTAYLKYLECVDDNERTDLLKQHITSIEKHIRTLQGKDYQSKVGAKRGDFVFMFMPHEGAFLSALRAKPDLWQNAFESHVILASPTHLITILQLVEQMWKVEKQSVNAENIAKEGTTLVNSISAFLTQLEKIGDGIEKTKAAYDNALNRLSTGRENVLRVARRLESLGIKPKNNIPPKMTDLLKNSDNVYLDDPD